MKIVRADVIVTCPGRNFVTLKIVTDEGVYGIGDATLNGRELAVASYLTDHVIPMLIGRDPARIEDIWQYLYRGAYWRRGPVTMSAIAAVDTALWDIKGKVADLPLYQLLGGASRDGVMVYGHANGSDIAETRRRGRRATSTRATRRSARSAACPGCASTYGVPKDSCTTSRPTTALPTENVWSTDEVSRLRAEAVRSAARRASASTHHLLHDVHHRLTPIEAGAPRQVARAVPAVLDGGPDAGRKPGGVPPDPPAHGHADRGRRDLQHDLGLPAADHRAADRLHPHDRRARRRHHAPAAHRRTWPSSIRCAPARHGATDLSPVCMGAALHFDLWVPNFGIQEYMRHTPETDAVFPHAYSFDDGIPASGRGAGHGVDIDEKLAASYPYEPSALPVNRLEDGTLWNW